jgi:glycerol-3-phosphate dehydrogenase
MQVFDIVVIGAGINGAGVAQVASAAGYKVLVLEKNSVAGQETSAASSKLIHGGLRYLETLEFSLVRESLQERELLLKIAPQLVHRQTFNIPIYKDTDRNQLTLHAGLSLYALLSGLKRHSFYRQARFEDWDKLDGLKTDNLKTVFQYQDAQTDDSALTQAVLASAQRIGAEIEFDASFINADIGKTQVSIRYRQQGVEKTATSRVLINAAGPWVYPLNQQLSPAPKMQPPDLIQGAHLVLDRPLHQAFYMEAPQDRRAVFLLPWKGRALLGTTETRVDEDCFPLQVFPQEREYLLEVYRHYFPHQSEIIIGEMAGLRVLAQGKQQVFKRSRDVVMTLNDRAAPRVLSIIGGKLTVYRRTALKALNMLQASLPDVKKIADTAKLELKPVD